MEDLRYDYAKEVYKIECDRENNLNNKSQIYLSLVTIIVSSLLFNIKDLFELLSTESIKKNQCISFVLIIIVILSVIGMAFLFSSIKIRKYKKPSAVTDLLNDYKKPEIDNEQFANKRSLDLLIATEHNEINNDKKADFLEYSLITILLSYLFCLFFVLQVTNTITMSDDNSKKQKELEEKQKKEQLLKEYYEKQKANQHTEEKRSKN